MADGIVSIDQVGTGFNFHISRLQREENYEKWYDGNYNSLMPKPDIDNGYNLIDYENLPLMPLHQISSDFQAESALADGPDMLGDSDELMSFIAEIRSVVQEELEKLTFQWAIKDLGVIATDEDGQVFSINPSNYFRVGDIEDDDERVGHILFYRYYEPGTDTAFLNHPDTTRENNRVRVVRYMPLEDINTTQTFVLEGNQIGEPLTEQEPAGITSLAVVGQWKPWYKDSQRIVAQFFISRGLYSKTIYKHINRPLVVPPAAFPNTKGDSRTPTEKARSIYEMKDPVLQASEQDGMGGLLMGDYDFPSIMDDIIYYAQNYYLISGTPPTAFGIDLGKGESGLARERAEDRAAIRIRNFRDDLIKVLPIIIRGMGAPDGEVTVSWRTDPFQTAMGREDIIRLYTAGLIDRPTAQEMLSLQVMETEEAPEENNALT